ncbi:hypothetical protein KBI23_09350 [bacterium]|nr:hypothetical protein [bacterium]MBP9810543.1 hypothetical protein [bacterium]
MNTLRAFHGDTSVKNKFLTRVRAHRQADEFRQKYFYWHNGVGCAVGCTIHSDNHELYETELGIPHILARLEDYLFEEMPDYMAKKWPVDFLSVIPVGADLSRVWPTFMVWCLTDSKRGVIKYARTDEQRQAIVEVARLYSEGCTDQAQWEAASSAAAVHYWDAISAKVKLNHRINAAQSAATSSITCDAVREDCKTRLHILSAELVTLSTEENAARCAVDAALGKLDALGWAVNAARRLAAKTPWDNLPGYEASCKSYKTMTKELLRLLKDAPLQPI